MEIPITKIDRDLYNEILYLLTDIKLIKGGFYVDKFLQNNPEIKNYLETCINNDILELENRIKANKGDS
uniref:Uncharacterized protein n=1 Tax=uncultured prokaryote TaxID=198431 RepID=A0A0H5QHC3_9ZZZZ|nr:hypothetical protein [uncultured prokaryote]